MGTVAKVLMTNPRKVKAADLEAKYGRTPAPEKNYRMWAAGNEDIIEIGSHFPTEQEFRDFLEMLYMEYDMDIVEVLWWSYK